jgi:hypothetical protein
MTQNRIIRRNFKGKLTTFVACLFIAACMWLFQSLNRSYTTTLQFPVKYLNLPKDKYIYSKLPQSCEASVKASGMKLLLSYFKPIDEVLVLDYQTQKKVYGNNGTTEKLIVSPQMLAFAFNTKLEIQRLKPDTIYLEYKKLFSKLVPVRANIKTSFKDNYQLVGSIQLKPSHVLITGDSLSIQTIDHIETEYKEWLNIEKARSENIKLKEYSGPLHCTYSIMEVSATAEVDRFTEKTLELDVIPVNVPSGYEVNLFPKKTKVTFNVAYQDFDFIKPDLFKIVVDFKDQLGKSQEQVLNIESRPGNIQHMQLYPEKVKTIFKRKM